MQFIPETNEDKRLLVVEGLITNQPGIDTIKLSISQPLGPKYVNEPAAGCDVSISDDLGQVYHLIESVAGTYVTDSTKFLGMVGREYILHISTNTLNNNLEYESLPMMMKPVPKIDSLYYEKITSKEKDNSSQAKEGCQVYLNTYDPTNKCNFYRWEYDETWEFRLPYDVPNKVCWISNNSDDINIKNNTYLAEDRVNRYPLKYISNVTDRLKVKYSILVNQYSLNENEYIYWEKLQNISEQVGGLYDMIPSAIPNNIYCLNNPNVEVLGYFSVSAVTSKRIFIKDNFSGIIDLYIECPEDTIRPPNKVDGLGFFSWIIEIHEDPYYRIITHNKSCVDCTLRGTKVEPLFWKDDEK